MKRFSSTTKATYRRSSAIKRIQLVIAILAVTLLLLFVMPKFMRFVAGTVMVPIVSLQHFASNSEAALPKYFRNRSILIAEINKLENQLVETRVNGTNEEDPTLKLMSFSNPDTITAEVIGRYGVMPHDTMVLNKGTRDGIMLHAPVYVGSETVIGYIGAVTEQTSVVSLVSTPKLETTVYITGPNIYTTAVGQGGGILEVGVPQGVPLAVGNEVITLGLGMSTYGQIIYVDSVDSRPEQYGYVGIAEPLNSIRVVEVGTDVLEPLSFAEVQVLMSLRRQEFTVVDVPEGVLVDLTDATTTATTTTATTTVEIDS